MVSKKRASFVLTAFNQNYRYNILIFYSAAKSVETGQDVAIKKVLKVFEKSILAKRALREIKLLRHFNGHENASTIPDLS